MITSKPYNAPSNCQYLRRYSLFTLIFSLVTAQASANSVGISYSQLEQQLSVQEETLTVKPSGMGVSFSHEFNTNFNMQLDYQQLAGRQEVTPN